MDWFSSQVKLENTALSKGSFLVCRTYHWKRQEDSSISSFWSGILSPSPNIFLIEYLLGLMFQGPNLENANLKYT